MNLRDIPLPGVIPRDGWHIKSHTLHLTYSTHINKRRYKSWFKRIVMPRYCNGGIILFLELAHEPPDRINPYLHTHVVIRTGIKPLLSRKNDIFHWPLREGEIEGYERVTAHIRILQTPSHLSDAKHHLSLQDPANSCLEDVGRVIPCIGQRRTIIVTPVPIQSPSIVRIRGQSILPIRKLEDLMRWQSDVVKIMNHNTALAQSIKSVEDPAQQEPRDNSALIPHEVITTPIDCTMNVVVDSCGKSGKRVLIRALLHSDPTRFLVIEGVPTADDLTEFLEKQVRNITWNEDCIIINTLFQENHNELDDLIAGIARTTRYVDCRNLWIFTNAVPKTSNVPSITWNIYRAYGNWENRAVTFLQPLSKEDARKQRHTEEVCISNYGKILPRRYE